MADRLMGQAFLQEPMPQHDPTVRASHIQSLPILAYKFSTACIARAFAEPQMAAFLLASLVRSKAQAFAKPKYSGHVLLVP